MLKMAVLRRRVDSVLGTDRKREDANSNKTIFHSEDFIPNVRHDKHSRDVFDNSMR